METLYYLFTVVFLWLEIKWVVSPIEQTNQAKKFFELRELNSNKKFEDFDNEYKQILKSKLWYILICIWFFIGLFTDQWIAYALFLIFNFTFVSPLSHITKFSLMYTILHWFNSLIGFMFGLFVIINHYHLKINLTELFTNLLK